MSDITSRVAKLPPEKLELLMRRLQEKREDVVKPKITQRDRSGEAVPLSFAQQRLWFIDQLEPNNVAYSIPVVLHLRGSLVVSALEQSLNEISRRHESLRTTFQTLDQQPIQVVSPPTDQPLTVIDLSHSASEQQAELHRLIEQPFDLVHGPIWSAKLLRLDETNHKLFLNIHHIVFDDWSLGVFLHELTVLYEAFVDHKPSPLVELPIQYSDFTVWQRDRLQGDVLKNLLDYWKQQLVGAPTLIDLPLDRPRIAKATYQSDRQPIQLSQSMSEALKKLARQEDATLFMVLFAAFAVLLHRYTHQDDILVGSPIANRNQVETEDLIGFFVNTLALRANLADNPTFRALLRQVRTTALEAYAHQDLPFEKLVEELKPERNPGSNPLVQVLFVLQTAPKSTVKLPNLELQCEGLDSRIAKFDLTLELQETSDGIAGWFEYKSDLFEAATIAQFTDHFERLLAALIANPNQSVRQVPLLKSDERQRLLSDWSQTVTIPITQCVHERFESQVQRHPDAIALRWCDQSMTYSELNQKANQVAHYLIERGITQTDIVGICLERSFSLMIVILGIVKAGGAYLPLDASYPASRLQQMVQAANPKFVVTQESLQGNVPAFEGDVYVWESIKACVESYPSHPPAAHTDPEALVYVPYTSGSTGTPKGVEICHRGVVRLITDPNYLTIQPSDRLLQLSLISFDASLLEIWGSLLNGATLVIYPDTTFTLAELGRILQHERITILWLTAGLFQLMVEERLEDLSQVRYLLAGGDRLSIPHVRRVLEQLPHCQIINGYGPTESTTFTTCHRIENLTPIDQSVPIGKPINNTQVYVLDQYQQLVPVGVPGELYIGGDGLARGYRNQPELTAERFVRHPFSADPTARLYRTGDRVRFRRDGVLEFLGRQDRQVKIRGFRVEPGDIEAVLTEHPQVAQSYVACQTIANDKRLIAYVVPIPGETPQDGELIQLLRQRLPNYLIPNGIQLLDRLPLTPSGKIDLAALPIPDSVAASDRYAEPKTKVQHQLVKIWEELLGSQPIGIQDNFWELGGHSLLAVSLFAQIQKTLGQDLPLATLFQAPTIAQLAHVLRQNGVQPSWSSLVPIQPNGANVPFFCVHGAGGNVVCFQALAQRLGPNQPFFGLQAEGLDGRKISRTTVEEIAAHYIKEIQTVQPEGPYCLGGFSAGGLIAFEMAQQLRSQKQEIGLLALLDTQLMELPYGLSDRLALHRKKLAQQGPTYVLNRIAEKREDLQHYIERQIRKRYLKRNQTLPLALREFYVLEANQQITDAYTPKPYSGRIDYFSCTEWEWFYPTDSQAVWGPLALGGLTVHPIPGQHLEIIVEPGIQVLAARLKACLDTVISVRSEFRG